MYYKVFISYKNGPRSLAEDFPKGSRASRRVPEGFQSIPKGSRRLAEHPEAFPNQTFGVQILKLLKNRCRRYFDPESVPKASRRVAEGLRKGSRSSRRHAEGMPNVVNSQFLPSGTLREPFGVLVETGLYGRPQRLSQANLDRNSLDRVTL